MSEQREQVALVVTFGAGADSSAVQHVEPDTHLKVDADGQAKSSFGPGDPYYFILQWDALKSPDPEMLIWSRVFATTLYAATHTPQMRRVRQAKPPVWDVPGGDVEVLSTHPRWERDPRYRAWATRRWGLP